MRIRNLFILVCLLLCSVGQGQERNGAKDTLKILSWNVFLRPSILKDRQLERIDDITQHLIHKDADILILQEVFHKKSKKILFQNLSKNYPFHTKEGKKSFWGISSGVYIFCKDSILSEKHIVFNSCSGADALAKKGAVKIRIKRKNKEVSVVGTHLQAGEGLKKNLIRKKQLEQIAKLNNEDSTIIFAGDFNIARKSKHYEDLEQTLNVKTIASKNIVTANFEDQDLFPVDGDPVWIDFILLNAKSNSSLINHSTEKPMKQGMYLSDHANIFATVILSN
ncbi:endonuclease/exonuclease/phosphatase family protein [Crocinitomicaceae bacterium]|nr:endonuclease/exonuclease/phosphatase family protein [Crocinitomicaceae bacterium]